MNRLRELRKKKKITAEKMADILGISVPYLYDLENGRRRLNQDLLSKICNNLGVSADYILGNDTAKKKEPDYNAPLQEKDLADALLKISEMIYEFNLPKEVSTKLIDKAIEKYGPPEKKGGIAAHGPNFPGSGAFNRGDGG